MAQKVIVLSASREDMTISNMAANIAQKLVVDLCNSEAHGYSLTMDYRELVMDSFWDTLVDMIISTTVDDRASEDADSGRLVVINPVNVSFDGRRYARSLIRKMILDRERKGWKFFCVGTKDTQDMFAKYGLCRERVFAHDGKSSSINERRSDYISILKLSIRESDVAIDSLA